MEELKVSEFIAKQFIDVHYWIVNGKPEPCTSITEGAINVKIKTGEAIPEIFIPNFLLHNRQYISNLVLRDQVIQLTPEQEEKYKLRFTKKIPVKPAVSKYTTERLLEKWKEIGDKEFKEWAEKTFKELVEIDKRKSPRVIIETIRKVIG